MLLNKEMYQCMEKIKKFTDKHGTDHLDGRLLEGFVSENIDNVRLLKQAELIYRDEHRLSILGPGFMAIEYYEQSKSNKRIQLLLLLFTIFSFIVACAAIYISVFGLPGAE